MKHCAPVRTRKSTRGRTLGEVGFIHCSRRNQLGRVAAYVYGDAPDLVLLEIDPDGLSVPVRFENLEGGSELFPHIYGPLPVEAVRHATAYVVPPIDAFLARRRPIVTEVAIWWNGDVHLQFGAYVTGDQPPIYLTSNVRAVLTYGNEWLLTRDRKGTLHIPGGRVEPDEELLAAVAREVYEELGCGIGHAELIGFIHYRHTTPKPEGCPYPYPDFIQVVYRAAVLNWPPTSTWSREDDWITESVLLPKTAESIAQVATIHRPFLERDRSEPSEVSSSPERANLQATVGDEK